MGETFMFEGIKEISDFGLIDDGETPVIIEYKQKTDESVEPYRIRTVATSTQQAEPPKAVRTQWSAATSVKAAPTGLLRPWRR